MESKPYSQVLWTVELGDEFKPEFDALAEEVQDELLAKTRLLQQFGPRLGRPNVDTLKDSKHANMKELRFNAADGVWRAAFAFDPGRKALIQKADARFDAHLRQIAKKERRERR